MTSWMRLTHKATVKEILIGYNRKRKRFLHWLRLSDLFFFRYSSRWLWDIHCHWVPQWLTLRRSSWILRDSHFSVIVLSIDRWNCSFWHSGCLGHCEASLTWVSCISVTLCNIWFKAHCLFGLSLVHVHWSLRTCWHRFLLLITNALLWANWSWMLHLLVVIIVFTNRTMIFWIKSVVHFVHGNFSQWKALVLHFLYYGFIQICFRYLFNFKKAFFILLF